MGNATTPGNVSQLLELYLNPAVVRVDDKLDCPQPDQAGDLFSFVFDTIVVGSLCVIGVVCNIIAVAAFANGRQTTTTCILIALSIADMLYLLTHGLMFQALRSIFPYTGTFESYSEVWPYIEPYEFPFGVSFQTLSIYCVVLVAIDRYIGVCWPLHARIWCTNRRARIQIIAVSVFVLTLNFPRFFVQKPAERYDNCTGTMVTVMVADKLGKSRLFNLIMGPVYLALIDIIPVVILIVVNIRLFLAIRESTKMKELMNNGSTSSSASQQKNKRERRWTLVLCVIIAVFLACQTPISVNHLMYAAQWTMDPNSQRHYNVFTNTLAAFNSACNFFIYVIMGARFRTQLKTMFKSLRQKSFRSRSTSYTTRKTVQSSSRSNGNKNSFSGVNNSFV